MWWCIKSVLELVKRLCNEWRLRRQRQQRTLIICSCTPSSVCGPWKQAQMVSMILSMSFLPGAVLSGALPVRWPYAISFYKAHTNANMSMSWGQSPRNDLSENTSLIFLVVSKHDLTWGRQKILTGYGKWRTHHIVDRNIHVNIWGSAVQLVLPLTCKQSSAVMTMRGHLDWHASSNGKKYLSASMKLVFDLIGGKVLEPDLLSPLGGLGRNNTHKERDGATVR